MTTLQDILDAAQGLPSAERAQLIHALWESLPPSEWTPPRDVVLDEVQRRSQKLDEGRLTTSPWAEVRQRARREAGLDD